MHWELLFVERPQRSWSTSQIVSAQPAGREPEPLAPLGTTTTSLVQAKRRIEREAAKRAAMRMPLYRPLAEKVARKDDEKRMGARHVVDPHAGIASDPRAARETTSRSM